MKARAMHCAILRLRRRAMVGNCSRLDILPPRPHRESSDQPGYPASRGVWVKLDVDRCALRHFAGLTRYGLVFARSHGQAPWGIPPA